jgi:2-methylcitrate dehydratase PrpD
MIVNEFADFALAQRRAGLQPEVQEAANRAVVDWFAATVAGSSMEPARILRATLLRSESGGSCGLVPDGARTSPRTAALINAAASHTAEMDDIYRDGLYHPGSPTVGAALAMAEHVHATGETLLRAVAVGYEIGDAIAATIQPAHYEYWHTTGTVGTIGAAAAAAEVLGLGAEEFAHALATATTMAAGLQQAFRSDAMSKPLHAGHAAEAGVLAAMAASNGFTGALDVLEGESGFGAAMAQSPDWSTVTQRLGGRWGVTEATVKNHSCCGHTFAAVDAALEARAAGLRADEVQAIHVSTYGTALRVAGNPNPRTAFEAKFSIAYCVAAGLIRGSVRLNAFEDEQLHHRGIRDLAGRVSLSIDPEFDATFPKQRAARVTITLHDGTEQLWTRTTRKGDPDDPLTDAELGKKFMDLALPVLGDPGAAELEKRLWMLPQLQDVAGLAGGQEGQAQEPDYGDKPNTTEKARH